MTGSAAGACLRATAANQEAAGACLRATAVNQRAAGACLRATAANQRGPVDLRPDYPARVVFHRAFELAVRRRFRGESPIVEIVRTVAIAARRHPFVPVDALAAEMLIRDVLGDAVPVEEIPLPVIVATHVLVFAAICDELALSDDEIDTLIATAEERAMSLR
jgi:hypothetical protein